MSEPARIGILEDNARRLAEMFAALRDTFPQAIPTSYRHGLYESTKES